MDENEFEIPDVIPRFSADLVDALEIMFPPPSFPTDIDKIAKLDEAAMRRLSFLAGRHHLIQLLKDWIPVEEDEDASAPDVPVFGNARVIGDDRNVVDIAVGAAEGLGDTTPGALLPDGGA